MLLIALGIILWAATHFMPSLAPDFKSGVVSRLGKIPYRGLFSLCVLAALGLIVIGWRSTSVELLYISAPALRHSAMLLMLVAFILVGAAAAPVRIKRYIRHPQLMGVVVWAIAHLLANGENRSVLLFAGMGSWAVIQMVLINRREGTWVKPEVAGWAREIKVLIISVVMMLVVMYLHRWFTGVALF